MRVPVHATASGFVTGLACGLVLSAKLGQIATVSGMLPV
jgi:hypothetical protein